MQDMFELECDMKWTVFDHVANLWRGWKSRLNTYDVQPFSYTDLEKHKDVPKRANDYVSPEEWTEFVEWVTSPEFDIINERMRQRRNNQRNQARVGRKGMTGCNDEHMEEGDEEPDKAGSWMWPMMNDAGGFDDPDIQVIVDEILRLKARQKSGELILNDDEDILSIATGVPIKVRKIHVCRFSATKTMLVPSKRMTTVAAELIRLRRKVKEFEDGQRALGEKSDVEEALAASQKKVEKLEKKLSDFYKSQEPYIPQPPFKEKDCTLFAIIDGKKEMVACGRIVADGALCFAMVHFKNVSPDQYKEKPELVEGKVDWHGKPAVQHKHGGFRAALLILATFGFENMATLGLAVNLTTYFTGVLHYDIADSANHLTNFLGISYIISLIVASIADTWLGRFKTCVFAGCIEFLGLALLTVQAHYPNLRPPVCNIYDPNADCKKLNGGHAAFFFIALYLLAIGSGGVKATLPSHGADQYNENDPREFKKMSSYFNCLLLALCIGGSISLTIIVWIQDNKGWDWGFGIPAIAMCLGVSIFIAGLPIYRMQAVKKTTALVEIAQVYVAAIRNRKLQLPNDSSELYEISKDNEAAMEAELLHHTDNLRFLDRAAIQVGNKDVSQWKLCRVTQVENAKIMLAMVPIFCCTIIMTVCLAQLQTFSVQQGITMDRSIGKSFNVPPASLPIIPVFMLVIIIPVYDRIIVPFLRKITGIPTGITHLQRIGVGLVLSAVSMAVAGLLEVKRKGVARDHNMIDAQPISQPLPISVFWLSFQYFIFGIADMFTYVGLLEFFYSEAPKALKAVSTCFLWSSMSLGYFTSSILVNIVNKATKNVTRSGGWLAGNNFNRNHLNLFYWLLSLLSLINFCVYLFVAKRYKYRTQIPEISEEKEPKT
ncbi:hypothetical protein ACFE04_000293 [Oxalis oulophora]